MGRVSIGRLMGIIGLAGLALALFRGWSGPENVLGYLGPIAMLGLLGFIATLALAGRYRWFAGGMTATATLLGLAILAAPALILDPAYDHFVLPIVHWFHPPPPTSANSWDRALYNAELYEGPAFFGQPSWSDWIPYHDSSYSYSKTLQSLLAIPQVFLAVVGGLIAARLRPRPAPPSNPPGPP